MTRGSLRRRLGHGLRVVWTTRRGLTTLARDALATLGVVGGSLQVYDILTPQATYHPLVMVAVLGLLPLGVGLRRAWPRHTLVRHLGIPDVTVTVTVGDLLAQDSHLVIGYTDTFDTDTTDPRVIHPSSVQAQFQRRHHPDLAALDAALGTALAGVPSRPAPAKRLGKSLRYPLGTTVVLPAGGRLAFCLAYATMDDQLVAHATADTIWNGLAGLWDAVHTHAHREPVSIAVIGTRLAKVDSLDHASLIRLIVLSFVARSRARPVTRRLTVVVHPDDAGAVDMLELAAFLATV
ncbi:MAG TPA: macro domain-containing protein [Pseudonocardiaceae bacterium]